MVVVVVVGVVFVVYAGVYGGEWCVVVCCGV